MVTEAVGRRDFEGAMRFYTGDSVWDVSDMGLGTYRDVLAIHREMEQWTGVYEEFAVEVEEMHDFDNGVVFAITQQGGVREGAAARFGCASLASPSGGRAPFAE